ncbi:hypothetical protein KXR53_34485 [Inquilinus limosus]|uniref:hypothetical protein n=1 Tax=Inquilinus limosus TaxID=171674 RepID=UPI003F182AD8
MPPRGVEEAGAIGAIEGRCRGHFRHRKRKARGRLHCRVAVYVMSVEKRLERFPEREERAVRWFTVDDARSAIRNRRLRELIARVSADLISSGHPLAERSVCRMPAPDIHAAARESEKAHDPKEQGRG